MITIKNGQIKVFGLLYKYLYAYVYKWFLHRYHPRPARPPPRGTSLGSWPGPAVQYYILFIHMSYKTRLTLFSGR